MQETTRHSADGKKHRPRSLSTGVLFVVLLFLCVNVSFAGILRLSAQPEYHLAGHMEMLLDPDGRLEIGDILAPRHNGRFTPLKAYVNRSYTNDTVWVRFSLLRGESFPDDAYLRLWPPYLDFVDVFVQQGADSTDPSAYITYHMGDNVPATQRPVLHPEFVAPLALPLNESRSVYIKIRTSSSLQLTASVHTLTDLMKHNNPTMLLHGGYLSIALVISIINLIFFIRLRERLYLYFSLYVIALFINHSATSGVVAVLWPKFTHLISDYFVGTGVGCALAFFSLFGMQLFNTANKPKTHLYFKLMIVMGSLTALSVPFGIYNRIAPFQFVWSLLIVIILTWYSMKESFRNEAGGRLYIAAFGISNIAYAILFMRLLGFIDVAWWNMYAMQFGSIFNMVLMTLALSERLHASEISALQTLRHSELKALELADEMTLGLQSKQKELENALVNNQEALKLKERFVAMLNHEYRTPLAIIQANISILELKTGSTNAQLVPIFTKIRRAMDRLVEVLETSLARERQSGADGKGNYQSLLLEPLLHGISLEAGNLWQGRNLIVTIPPMPDKRVLGDAILLKTAYLNLLDNAFKYSPADRTVEMTVHPGDGNVIITVSDHGYGIPTDQLEQVFINKYRVPGTIVAGEGIGLYLVKSVIEQHGGSVTLASSVNAGTTATTILPLANR